ncbi:hypothetical protein CgunFtcFv8_002930 [Champsocephalus gunnari]|uniref:Uncharacterized protein n=1 Tax=Champsocephalus gunnari TaxID=52237 RepID=A0AAN8HJZ5_CHAGU|nr:hypothetical protein CgunFtcFv8_002930 [Champsocephalus gunnari]
MAQEDMDQLEQGQAIWVTGQEVLEPGALAQEVLELGLGVLDLEERVDLDLVAKHLGTGSLLNQVTARRWEEAAMDQVVQQQEEQEVLRGQVRV